MEIVKIDPNEKYVLLLSDASKREVEQILTSLRSFMEDDVHVLFAISGAGVAIVPAGQVVGYKVLK